MSELRRIVRSIVKESYGWPVEREEHIFGARTKIDVQNPRDPKNTNIQMPKGPNSRDKMAEGFVRPTQRELSAWKQGDYAYDSLNEEAEKDPCDGCGEMVPGDKLEQVEGKYMCQSCMGH